MKLSAIGVTPQKEKQFNGKGIFSVEDMVRYLPRKYNDFSRETGILPDDQISCLIVTVNKVCTYNNGKPLMIVFCETEDGKRITTNTTKAPYPKATTVSAITYRYRKKRVLSAMEQQELTSS